MFLDDQLYQKVKSTDIKKPEDFQELVSELYKICDTYLKTKMIPMVEASFKTVRQETDKVFTFWDMFINRLNKENWWLIDILEKYSYKNEYLSNEKLREIYDRGK